MIRPTFVLVPGASHSPEIYAATIDLLNKQGYPAVGCPLPSVDARPAHQDFAGDVAAVRSCLTELVDEGKDVILVSHSYSGMPATEAPVGLDKASREKNGLKGGLIRLVYIMAFAMPEGFRPTAGGAKFPDWMKIDAESDMATIEPEDAKAIFYNDLDSPESDKWVAKLRPQSVGVFNSTMTYAAWRYVPSTFIIGPEDRTQFTPEIVDFMINSARQQVPTAFDVVETCEGGAHCLMVSHPEWLAGALRRAAGETV